MEEAAGLPVPVETALRALRLLDVQHGQTLVRTGAAGGVGSAVVQIAQDRGAAVIGTASPGNHAYLLELGAVATTYGDGLIQRIRELAPDRVDAALDLAGAGAIPDLVELTGDPVKVLSVVDFDATDYGAQVSFEPERAQEALEEAARLVAAGRLSVRIADTYPLGDAGRAHVQSASGHAQGRLILTVE